MSKLIKPKQQYGGIFGNSSDALYEKRDVRTLEDAFKLSKEGFIITEDPGLFLLNFFINH